ncbi:MmgE/PrpD family protein [Sphingobium sp.]|uniref:MmgE/PrpD family protein n=1 Tax=Sphingobium sp. TaxID=1912891 RepID=UPI0028BF0CB5|nr:MmgE/PrpD family protein [Sphingobium sp.]
MAIADRFAEFVCETHFDSIAPAVVERAKDLCISAIGSTILGARMEVPRIMADHVRAQGAVTQASVLGHSFQTSVELAAMLNCDSSHCTELEDVAWPEAQYTCCLIPAMFTLGEWLNASGQAVVEATIIGFEVAARPGMVLSNGGAAARGWLSCANVGTLGVAAGAAKMLGLDFGKTRDAITLAASMGGGLVRQTGSAAHVVEAGFAARDGIMAALLAQRGLGGNPSIMDGKAGYFDALAGQADLPLSLGSGEDFRVMAVGQKKYPCCYMLQRIIDRMKALIAQHDIRADDVREVRVEVNAAFPTIMKYPVPADVEEARFSLPHVVAATLAGEPMDARTFSAEKLNDPKILELRPRVRMVVHVDWGNDQLGAEDWITIRLRDGREIKGTAIRAHGDAEDPLSREETLAKFATCTDGLLSTDLQTGTAGALAQLERLPGVALLMRSLAFGEAIAAIA